MDVPILSGETWSVPSTAAWSPVHNPSTGDEIARVPMCGAAEVDAVVEAALVAYATWSKTSVPARSAKSCSRGGTTLIGGLKAGNCDLKSPCHLR